MTKVKELKNEDFKYVDARHVDRNGKESGWKRIEVSEIASYQQDEAFNYNVFTTVQRFANPKERIKGEPFTAPLYFDFDSEADPSASQVDAVKLIDFFMQELGVQETDIWAYFSGSKGFHVLIAPEVFGIVPRTDNHKIFKHIAGYLVHRLGLQTLDLVVYTAPRMLRLPNSQHSKTNLFKIELTLGEMHGLTLDQIKEMAKSPRKPSESPCLTEKVRSENIAYRQAAGEFYNAKTVEYAEAAATSSKRYEKEEFVFRKGEPPVCVLDILNDGWKKDGDRNQATVQLACYYKDAGHSREDCAEILVDWIAKHSSATSSYQIEKRLANTRSVVDAVYASDNTYRFGCAFIRSLHGEKTPGSNDYKRVACAGDMCPCLKKTEADSDDQRAMTLHLSQTGDSELWEKLIKTNVMIAGKRHTPYIVPRKVEYHCWGRDGCKKNWCPLYDLPSHTGYKDLGVHNREIIQMCGVGDDNVKGILKEMSGIPNCAKYDTQIVETVNVEELLVIPMAANRGDEDAEGKYVLRQVYAVGNTSISENRYYSIKGYVFSHPKNQESTILIREAMPLQDEIDSFRLTEDVKEQLSVFRPEDYTAESIGARLESICDDLTYNVTGIVERHEVLMGVLLTMHSILRFRVPWDTEPIRGWVEGKITGDTGTGKSALVDKVTKFAGVGTRVNAESTSRTGLTYKIEQRGSGGAWYIVWGAWPQSDKQFIWLDEDTGIEKDEYGEMTLARSEGVLEVKRAVTAETPCRVRAILSGNPVKGRRLADYGQGVEALKDIFNNEDIRRFDFAIFMRSTDVAPEKYNEELAMYPSIVSSATLRNNILFAWSRRSDDVIFNAGTIERILELSTELSKTYGNATDVPLVSSSDQRNKIARLAVALAALTHSVDESGERIMVWPGHVDFIGHWLTAIYNAPGCGLNYYAKLAIREEEMTEEKFQKITNALRSDEIGTLKGERKFFEFLRLFAQQRYVRLGDMEAMLAIEKDEAKGIVAKLQVMRMIKPTTGGFTKTPRFNAYVAKCFELGMFADVDDDF